MHSGQPAPWTRAGQILSSFRKARATSPGLVVLEREFLSVFSFVAS